MAATEHSPRYIDLDNPALSLDILEGSELVVDAPRLDGAIRGTLDSYEIGRGHLPDGMREYRPGRDDPHMINHKRSARDTLGRLWVTQRFHEVTPRVLFATDATNARHAQVAPGTPEQPVLATEQRVALSALVALSHVASLQDMDHAVVMDRGSNVYDTEFGLGEDHDMGIVHDLRRAAEAKHRPASDRLAQVMRTAGSLATERGLVVVVSDFLEPVNTWKPQLEGLVDDGHDVLALKVASPANMQINPAVTRVNAGDRALWADLPGLREAYARKAVDKHAEIARTLRASGVRALSVSNADQMWDTTLRKQLYES